MSGAAPPLRMPAEWEPHRATWIGWPHHEPDWPGKLAIIPTAFAEMARVLSAHERVEIICSSEQVREQARACLELNGVRTECVGLHLVPNDRIWLRDSGATGAVDASGQVVLLSWGFNGWAKYDNYRLDEHVGAAMEKITGLPRVEPRLDNGAKIVLEGGGIETNGDGLLLVTEEWLLTDVQVRNPGLSRTDYERIFAEWLGTRRTIWLGEGCRGDDTHGHIDDVARFVSRDTVVIAFAEDPSDDNHAASVDNLRRLELASRDPEVGPLRIVRLPFPRAMFAFGERLPASYANFYIGNGVVMVPTFNDPNDRVALNILADLFPAREMIGIHARDLIWGQGTLHCLTQQEPLGASRV